MNQAPVHIRRQRSIGIEAVNVYGKKGEKKTIYAKVVNGLLLMERSEFIRYIEDENMVNRLVNYNLLTSYHSNGQPKERKNGKLPSGRTYYNVRQWLKIDFNNLTQ